MAAYQKQISYSASKKGQIFLIEIAFAFVIFLSFIVAYSTINTNIDNTNTINYFKTQDVFTVSVAKQLDEKGIEKLIKWYLPNADYNICEPPHKPKLQITGKQECYARNIRIWKPTPLDLNKMHKIYVKICF